MRTHFHNGINVESLKIRPSNAAARYGWHDAQIKKKIKTHKTRAKSLNVRATRMPAIA